MNRLIKMKIISSSRGFAARRTVNQNLPSASEIEIPNPEYRPLGLKSMTSFDGFKSLVKNYAGMAMGYERLKNTYFSINQLFGTFGGSKLSVLWPQKTFQKQLGQVYVDLNKAVANNFDSGDLEQIEKLTSFDLYKKCLAELKAREKIPNGKNSLKFTYDLQKPLFSLVHLGFMSTADNSIGIASLRVRGNQVAYIEKTDGSLLAGSRIPTKVDELIDLYFFHWAEHEPAFSTGPCPSLEWRVNKKSKYVTK